MNGVPKTSEQVNTGRLIVAIMGLVFTVCVAVVAAAGVHYQQVGRIDQHEVSIRRLEAITAEYGKDIIAVRLGMEGLLAKQNVPRPTKRDIETEFQRYKGE